MDERENGQQEQKSDIEKNKGCPAPGSNIMRRLRQRQQSGDLKSGCAANEPSHRKNRQRPDIRLNRVQDASPADDQDRISTIYQLQAVALHGKLMPFAK